MQHRHAVLLGRLADRRGDEVDALGDHLGRGLGAVVAERDREVGRVRDDDVGGRRRRPACAGGPCWNWRRRIAPLHLRRDVGWRASCLHLVLGHPQRLLVAVALPGEVDDPRAGANATHTPKASGIDRRRPASSAISSGGMPDEAAQRRQLRPDRDRTRPRATTAVLTIALPRLEQAACGPNRRLKPARGSIRENCGLSAAVVILGRTCSTLATTPRDRRRRRRSGRRSRSSS